MATATYNESLKRLLAHEGGYSNHPSDPGGPTNWGITIIDARKYWKFNASSDDVRSMPLSTARGIYKEKYWNALRCDELPAGVDYAVFDYGVNSGIGRSGKVLRRVLGLPDNTHVVTEQVRGELLGKNPASVVAMICDERMAFLRRLKTWPVFGVGWARRVAGVRTVGTRMAVGKPPETAVLPPTLPAPGKGEVPINRKAQTGGIGGAIATGTAASTQAPDLITVIIIVVVTIAAALGAWWFIEWRRKRQQDAPVPIKMAA